METVYKYPLEITDEQELEIPAGAKILSVQFQGGQLCLWAEVNPKHEMVRLIIDIEGTGHPLHPKRKYIGTVQQGPFVWHVYERGQQ